MDKDSPDISISVNDEIQVNESVTISTESEYLIISNKEKVVEILSRKELSEENIIDVFISLHMVLEVGLNTLFRHISLSSIKKDVDRLEIMRNIDGVSFIDKTILFVYNSKFNFEDIGAATHYHGIIGTLKDFSFIRNQLLHGHSIITVADEQGSRSSRLKEILNKKGLGKQIEKFLFILEGMRFYVDCLDSSFTQASKESLKKSYLDNSFLKQKKST